MAENETVSDVVVEQETLATTTEATETSKVEIPKEVKDALKKANKEAETLRLRLKEYEDKDKSELQKAQEAAESAQSELNTLRLDALRREVADEKGLTPAQAKRLVGTTREELEADADDVLATFPINTKSFGNIGQGASRGESASRVYTLAEISDHAFYLKHKDDILAAQREGRISTN